MKTIVEDKVTVQFRCKKCWCLFDSNEYWFRLTDFYKIPKRLQDTYAYDYCPKCKETCSYRLK